VQAIQNWPTPSNATQVRSFLGLANYYRRFIQDFAHIAAPLNELTRKDQTFVWLPRHQAAFDRLKAALTSAPVLALPDFTRPFEIHTDASGVAIGAVLSQEAEQGSRPIAYFSATLTPAERNYATYDQELLAVVRALRA